MITTEITEKDLENLNRISGEIVDAAIQVHKTLGPGLLESTYEACLAHELRKRNLKVATQVALPVVYDGVELQVGYRIDVLVENAVIVEIKTVDSLHKLHEAQLISYLKLANKKLGLLINFNVVYLKEGIRRFMN